jgi:hypothetical protein
MVELTKIIEVNKLVSEEYANEFMKLIKHRKYNGGSVEKYISRDLSIMINYEFRLA